MIPAPEFVRARLAERVRRSPTGCLLWRRSLQSNGYAQMRVRGRLFLAHRLAYELAAGPIPEGLELDHVCGNRHCVEPTHVQPVTHAEHMRRTAARRAAKAGAR